MKRGENNPVYAQFVEEKMADDGMIDWWEYHELNKQYERLGARDKQNEEKEKVERLKSQMVLEAGD